MLNNTQQAFEKVKKALLRQQKEVESQIKSIEQDDPVFIPTIESTESGTESWQADVHSRISSLKEDLINLSKRIKDTVLRINKGTYGKCDNCGKEIEPARLEAMPTASLCLECSKKSPKIRSKNK